MSLFSDMIGAGLSVIHDVAGSEIVYTQPAGVGAPRSFLAVPRSINPQVRAQYDAQVLVNSRLWEIQLSQWFRYGPFIGDEPVVGATIEEEVKNEPTRTITWEVVNDPVTGRCFEKVGSSGKAIRIFTLKKAV
jgi:hypothetical protein